MGAYGRTIDEFDDAPRLGADEAIAAARTKVGSSRVPVYPRLLPLRTPTPHVWLST